MMWVKSPGFRWDVNTVASNKLALKSPVQSGHGSQWSDRKFWVLKICTSLRDAWRGKGGHPWNGYGGWNCFAFAGFPQRPCPAHVYSHFRRNVRENRPSGLIWLECLRGFE